MRLVFKTQDLPERLAAGQMHGAKCIRFCEDFQRGDGKAGLTMELLDGSKQSAPRSRGDDRIRMLLPESFELAKAETKG